MQPSRWETIGTRSTPFFEVVIAKVSDEPNLTVVVR